MANTLVATSWGAKWFGANLQATLKAALVAEKICNVDRSGNFYIWNPYGTAPTTTVQSISGGSQGTYNISSSVNNTDTLTVTDEFYSSVQVYDFERVMQHGDPRNYWMDELIASVATAIDKFVDKIANYKSFLIYGETPAVENALQAA